MRTILLVIALAGCSLVAASPAPDLDCVAAGDEIEVEPLNLAAAAWMTAEGFFPWRWEDGHRIRISGLFSPGYRGDVGWLSYAETAGWIASPKCWALAGRYSRQNEAGLTRRP